MTGWDSREWIGLVGCGLRRDLEISVGFGASRFIVLAMLDGGGLTSEERPKHRGPASGRCCS